MMNLPINLQEYLKGNGKHLKVIATFSDSQNIVHWALFFGNKGAKPNGDNDFTGAVIGDPLGKVNWQSKRPFWFIPISEEAKKEAGDALAQDRMPGIDNYVLTVRNSKNSGTWNDYQFWYEDRTSWSKDLIVTLDPSNQQLKFSAGKWNGFTLDGWPVWITKDIVKTSNRAIEIPAPRCEIIDKDGKRVNHSIWFGVREDESLPFLAITRTTAHTADDGLDCPVVWTSDIRKDYLLLANDEGEVTAASWKKEVPVKTLYEIYGVIELIIDGFKYANSADIELRSWLIREKDRLNCIYTRHYFPAGNLAKLISSTSDKNRVSIIQIFRGAYYFISRIGDFHQEKNHCFLNLWNKKTAAIADGLAETSKASPVGVVPNFLKNTNVPYYNYISEWSAENREADINYDLVKSVIYYQSASAPFIIDKVTLPQIHQQRFDRPDEKIVLTDAYFQADVAGGFTNDNATLFQLFLTSYKLPEEEIVLQDGSFAFKLGTGNAPEIKDFPKRYGRFRLTLQLVKAQRPLFLWHWYEKIDTQDKIVVSYAVEDFSLPVVQVDAAGQDVIAKDKLLAPGSLGAVVEGMGERSDPPLIIPLQKPHTGSGDGAGMAKNAAYLLSFSESVNVSQNHRLDIKLQGVNPETTDHSSQMKAVIIDASPQMVSLVDAKFLQQPGYDDGAWVLARKSPLADEDGGWQILDDTAETEGFRLILPAQAIGEAYVKNDLIGEEITAGGNVKKIIVEGEPQIGKSIEYRFGAPAILRLAPERLERRYVTAPWNLRRIWGQPGGVFPGIPLLEVQFELLYGLTGLLKPEKAFLAEIAAKLGEIPVPPVNSVAWSPTSEQEKKFREAWEQYLRFYRAWQSRLAILEPSQIDPFGNAAFNENISFNTRISVKQNADGAFIKDKGASLKYPILKKDADATLPLKEQTLLDQKIAAAHDPNGLAGGHNYGFESEAIYKEFFRENFSKGSSSGEIKALALSSLGGWGQQIARFAGDKTVLKSTTAMGRTHFYAVERIGRIGVYWNKAKHVIEYERTVVPAIQFPYQPEHLGRPLVRKVREYVEILEPTRSYPDFKGNDPTAAGAVLYVTFKSKIIPVLSSWGHDVWGEAWERVPNTTAHTLKKGYIGWEVPLWKLGLDPKVYPKPQIINGLVPPPDFDGESVEVNLSEPQNLWFYTDTREFIVDHEKEIPVTADVYVWPPVLNVDFADLPEPEQYNIAPAAGNSSELLDTPMPDVLAVAPGFERYTFRVDRNEIPSSVAGKYYPASAVTGRLRTVTMMRNVFRKDESWWATSANTPLNQHIDALTALIKGDNSLIATAANGFIEIDRSIKRKEAVSIDDFKKRIDGYFINGLADKLKQISGADITPHLINQLETLWPYGAAFETPVKWLWKESLEAASAFINKIMGNYDTHTKNLLQELAAISANGDQVVENGKIAIERLQSNVTLFFNEIEFGIEGAFSSIKKTIDFTTNDALKFVEEIFDKVINSIEEIDRKTDLNTIKARLKNEVDEKFKIINDNLDNTVNVLSKINDTDWQTKVAVLKVYVEKLKDTQAELITIINDSNLPVEDYIKAIKSKFSAQINTAKGMLNNAIVAIQNASISLLTATKSDYQDINTSLNQVGKSIKTKVDEIVKDFIRIWSDASTATIANITKLLADLRDKILNEVLLNTILPVLHDADAGKITIFKALNELNSIVADLEKLVKSKLLDCLGAGQVDEWLDTLQPYQRLADAIESGDTSAILQQSTALANNINQEFGRLAGEVTDQIKALDFVQGTGREVMNTGQQTLNNFRSVWEEFTAPGMGLNRKTVAMIVKTDWKDVEERLSLTPCITKVKQFGNSLEGLGLKMPVSSLTDRLLPGIKDIGAAGKAALSDFDFSNLLSDLGGMRLDKLFPGLKMPEFARDKIRITQGFDKDNLIAWVNAEAEIVLTGKNQLMSIGPFTVDLVDGNFSGKIRLEINGDGKIKKTNSGQLIGSWHMGIGGTPLMIFKEAGVIFKDDKLTFDLNPNRMEMPGLLKVLTDASTQITNSGAAGDAGPDGEETEVFKVGLLKVGEIPAGMLATLNIPPISVGGGTTSISNLSFGGFFMLSALDEDLQFRFLLGLGFYLGKKDLPFNLTVFILGGGGYIDTAVYYEPAKGLTMDFVMSVHASVAIVVAMGWMQGGVIIMIGFEGEYHVKPDTAASVYVSIFIHVIGSVSILSLVTVYLSLLLQATYRTLPGGGSELYGKGQVKVTIRVCRFVTIKVNKTYEKQFAGTNNGSGNRSVTAKKPEYDALLAKRVQSISNSLA